jgi:hypothetical protein
MKANEDHEVVIGETVYPSMREAKNHWVNLSWRGKNLDGTYPTMVEMEMNAIKDAMRAIDQQIMGTTPEGEEPKVYTEVKPYTDLYRVSHTYDKNGVKVDVGTLVHYKTHTSTYRIMEITYYEGREHMTIQRSVRSGWNGQQFSYVVGPEIEAIMFDGRVSRG